MPTCPSRSTGAYATHGAASGSISSNCTTDRGTRDNAVRLRHVEPARVPLRYAASSPPQVLDSLNRLVKAQLRRPPDFLLDTLLKTRSESIEATLRRRRILFAGFETRMEETRLPKCVVFGEWRGAGAMGGGTKNSGWGVSRTTSELSPSTPTSRRLQFRMRGNGAEW